MGKDFWSGIYVSEQIRIRKNDTVVRFGGSRREQGQAPQVRVTFQGLDHSPLQGNKGAEDSPNTTRIQHFSARNPHYFLSDIFWREDNIEKDLEGNAWDEVAQINR